MLFLGIHKIYHSPETSSREIKHNYNSKYDYIYFIDLDCSGKLSDETS